MENICVEAPKIINEEISHSWHKRNSITQLDKMEINDWDYVKLVLCVDVREK